jgi:hypothetical protein
MKSKKFLSHFSTFISLFAITAIAAVCFLSVSPSVQAQPATPPSTTLIQACVDRQNGKLRIVNTANACRRDEQPLSWNQMGVPGAQGTPGTPGAQGAQGLPGAAGAQGAQGLPGVSGYERVVVTTNNEQLGAFGETVRTISCPAGKKVVSGGGIIFNASGRWYLDTSGPVSDTQWAIAFANATANPITAGQMSVSAICVTANP